MNNKEGLIYQAFASCCELLFIKLCVVHTLKLVQNASHRAKFIKVKAREKKNQSPFQTCPGPFQISVTSSRRPQPLIILVFIHEMAFQLP